MLTVIHNALLCPHVYGSQQKPVLPADTTVSCSCKPQTCNPQLDLPRVNFFIFKHLLQTVSAEGKLPSFNRALLTHVFLAV